MFIQFLFCLLNYSFFKRFPFSKSPKNESTSVERACSADLSPDLIYLIASERARDIIRNRGEDMRPSGGHEISEEEMALLQIKKMWVDNLTSPTASDESKMDIIAKDLEPTYKSFDIYAGGLLNDW